jgi:hypothetical protein
MSYKKSELRWSYVAKNMVDRAYSFDSIIINSNNFELYVLVIVLIS